MKHSTLKSDIKLKDGTVFSAGSSVIVVWDNEKLSLAIDGRTFRVNGYSLKNIKGFTVPSSATLEKWVDNGVCKSITGKTVEPDGYGSDGSPSWLLAMGLI
jgi:hypothetical protein